MRHPAAQAPLSHMQSSDIWHLVALSVLQVVQVVPAKMKQPNALAESVLHISPLRSAQVWSRQVIVAWSHMQPMVPAAQDSYVPARPHEAIGLGTHLVATLVPAVAVALGFHQQPVLAVQGPSTK